MEGKASCLPKLLTCEKGEKGGTLGVWVMMLRLLLYHLLNAVQNFGLTSARKEMMTESEWERATQTVIGRR